jgi:hypothetical protein
MLLVQRQNIQDKGAPQNDIQCIDLKQINFMLH